MRIRRRRRLHVVVEALCLGPHQAGTQTSALAITSALARHPAVGRVDVLVPSRLPDYAQSALTGHPKVTVHSIAWLEPGDANPSADVVFRPYSVSNAAELPWLRSHARRVVVHWLDLIAYRNPTYFPNAESWEDYGRAARETLQGVDGVATSTQHVLGELRMEQLLATEMPTAVIGSGADHAGSGAVVPVCPAGVEHLSGFVLVLGASYQHKNRLLALQAFAELRARGWDGALVLAGPRTEFGSSRADEQAFLAAHPDLAPHVVTLGWVEDEEKAWLYDHAGLVLYPTADEGFGLIPFEAAAHGTPCLSSRLGSLDEVLGPDVLTIESFDAADIADQAFQLLTDRSAATKVVYALRERAKAFTWDDTVTKLVDLMHDVSR